MNSIWSLLALTVTCLLITLPNIDTASKSSHKKHPFGRKVTQCHKADVKLNDCIKTALNTMMHSLAKGVPQFAIAPLDPLVLKTFNVEQGRGGPIAIDLRFHDLNILGITSAKIHTINTDLENYKISLDAVLDKPIILDGQYKIKGSILILPITGHGKSNLTLTNFRCHMAIHCKPVEKNGRTHWQIEEFIFKLKTNRLYIKLENLFEGDQRLGDNMNRFMNDNWQILLSEMQPGFEANLGTAFKEITNHVFAKNPIDSILPL